MGSITSVWGPMGTGKSTLIAKWKEGKTFWMDLELGAKRALSRVPNWESRIQLWHPYDEAEDEDTLKDLLDRMNAMRGEVLEGRVEYWETILKKFLTKCADFNTDIIAFDTWKEIWSANTQAFLQRVQETTPGAKPRQNLIQIEYGTPNSRMNSVLATARKFGKELILTSHERPVYVYGIDEDGKSTSYPDPEGSVELDGYKNTKDLVDWEFKSSVQRGCKENGKKIGPVTHKCTGTHFKYEILKSPVDAGHVGHVFTDLSHEMLSNFVTAQGYVMV